MWKSHSAVKNIDYNQNIIAECQDKRYSAMSNLVLNSVRPDGSDKIWLANIFGQSAEGF